MAASAFCLVSPDQKWLLYSRFLSYNTCSAAIASTAAFSTDPSMTLQEIPACTIKKCISISLRWVGKQTYSCTEDGLQTLNITDCKRCSWSSPIGCGEDKSPASYLAIICIKVRMQTIFGYQWHKIGGIQHKYQNTSMPDTLLASTVKPGEHHTDDAYDAQWWHSRNRMQWSTVLNAADRSSSANDTVWNVDW